jgi:hypothetical protein
MLSLVVLIKLDGALASTEPSVLLLAAPQRALMRVNSSRIWSKLGLSAANRQKQNNTTHSSHHVACGHLGSITGTYFAAAGTRGACASYRQQHN